MKFQKMSYYFYTLPESSSITYSYCTLLLLSSLAVLIYEITFISKSKNWQPGRRKLLFQVQFLCSDRQFKYITAVSIPEPDPLFL